ncbi:MAG: DUF6020 family protein [Pelolinea sp.]|nr:DUF6020 family protein [Pelolinea sp.]
MKKIRQFYQQLFPSTRHLVFAILIGLAISLSIYLGLLQRHFFSWSYLAYAVLIAAAGILLAGWLNRYVIFRFFTETPKTARNFVILFSVLLSLVLLFNTEIQPLYYTLPDSVLTIRFNIPALPEGEEGIRLLWVKTGQGYVHYTRMAVDGDWERVFGNTVFAPEQSVTLTWRGKVGPKAEIALRQTDFNQPVEVAWNGVIKTYNLNNPKEPNIYIEDRFKVPVLYLLPFTLAFLFAVGYGIFAPMLLLAAWEPGRRKQPLKKRWHWLLYMLPMLLVWGFTLLIFWPGIMSNDSLAQWTQGVTGQYNDWQSGFHALLLVGLMRVWYSPAVIAILQLLSFALVVAWGLKTLQEYGTPRIVLWSISILFAVLPTNGILSITLWKDIPYAIAFLWLNVIIVKIVLSKADWTRKGINWVWLGIAAFLVAIFRHNGAAVAAVCLLALLAVYRKSWKPFLGAILVATLLYLGVKGPLYSAVNMDRASTGQTNLIYLHHIAAHQSAGTRMEPEESAYLESFMPLKDWDYWCCYVGTISYNGSFDRQSFLSSTPQNRKLAFTLFAREPLVDISHAFCAGELAWKFENNACYMKSTHGINTWHPGKVDWIGANEAGLDNHSLLPGLVDPFVLYLRKFGFLDDMLVFWLRPAYWLYLAVFSAAVLVIRRRDAHFLLALLPALSQTAVLMLVSFAPAFRYHYGTVLAGVFLLGLIFIPKSSSNR